MQIQRPQGTVQRQQCLGVRVPSSRVVAASEVRGLHVTAASVIRGLTCDSAGDGQDAAITHILQTSLLSCSDPCATACCRPRQSQQDARAKDWRQQWSRIRSGYACDEASCGTGTSPTNWCRTAQWAPSLPGRNHSRTTGLDNRNSNSYLVAPPRGVTSPCHIQPCLKEAPRSALASHYCWLLGPRPLQPAAPGPHLLHTMADITTMLHYSRSCSRHMPGSCPLPRRTCCSMLQGVQHTTRAPQPIAWGPRRCTSLHHQLKALPQLVLHP
jgi:hypothetical protein